MSNRDGQFTRSTHTHQVTSRQSVYKVNTHKPGHIAVVNLQGQSTQTRSYRGGQFTRWNTHTHTHTPGHIAAVNLQGQHTQTRSHCGGQLTRSKHTNVNMKNLPIVLSLHDKISQTVMAMCDTPFRYVWLCFGAYR